MTLASGGPSMDPLRTRLRIRITFGMRHVQKSATLRTT